MDPESYGDVERIESVSDALIFCDFFAKYGKGDFRIQLGGMADVIRSLTRRLEEQAMRSERAEAKRGGRGDAG